MKTICVTGFGAFGGRSVNGSEPVVGPGFAEEMLVGTDQDPEVKISTRVLPVVWSAIDGFELEPDVSHWLGLGEGHDYGIFIERIAVRARQRLGIDGKLPVQLPREYPDFYRLDLRWGWDVHPNHELWGVPEPHMLGLPTGSPGIVENFSAGTYMCNAIAYNMAMAQERRRKNMGRPLLQTGFIHIPPQGAWMERNPNGNYVQIMRRVVKAVLLYNGWIRRAC